MTKKKLLFIHHVGDKSGAVNSLITLIKHLDKEKYEINTLCPEGTAFDALKKVSDSIFKIPELPEIITISGYPHNYLRIFKALLLFSNVKNVVKIVQEINPDLIHLNEISLTPLAKQLKKKKYKIVMHARVVLDYRAKIFNKIIINRIKKYADQVICIDGSVQFPLKSLNNTTVVYNSYQFNDNEINLPAPSPSSKKFVILFLANLIGYKGIFDLIEASKQLNDKQNLEVWIAGANSRSDKFFHTLKGKVLSFLDIVPNNKKKIELLIKEHDLKNIKLLGHVEDIGSLIKNSSVLIFPSYLNGPSRSIFEAGVFGKPSIISLHNKLEDVVENNKTGLIIDQGSPEQIAKSILKLYNDPSFCIMLGVNASKKYQTLNNPKRNNSEIEKIFNKILY